MEQELAELRLRIDRLEASRVTLIVALGAVISMHPNYEAMQLRMTGMLEQQLGGGALGNTLTAEQKRYAADVGESIQGVQKIDEQELQKLLASFRLNDGPAPGDATR